MPRIHPIQLEQADSAIQKTLADVKANIGMVPNLYATFAHAPAVLNGYLQLNETLSKGRLTPAQRETIALAVGQANQCHYCLSAHSLIAKGAGLSKEEVLLARHGDSRDGFASLAALIVANRGVLSEQEFQSAKALGFDDETILEVIANVALNILTNYTNHIAETAIDFPLVELNL